MPSLFEAHNLVYLASLALGAIFVLAGVAGLIDMEGADLELDLDADIDMDLDVDADVDADAEVEGAGPGFGAQLLAFFGVGRAPLSVLLIAGPMSFGLVGLIANRAFSTHDFRDALVLGVAVLASAAATSLTGRAFAKMVPPSNQVVARAGLVGCAGHASVAVDQSFGLANVVDDEGARHQIRCRVETLESEDALEKGAPVVVTDFDEASGLYTVTRFSV